MAQIAGGRTTAQAISEDRLIRDVSDLFMLEPEEAPLITFLGNLNRISETTNPKFEWFEDDFVARWAQNSASAVANTTASTTVTVTDGTLFKVGDLFIVPKAVTSATTPEMCRVTAVSSNTLTVSRAVGGSGTVDTIAANAALALVGNAYEEHGSLASAKTTTVAGKFNYTQIFKDSVKISRTAAQTAHYGDPSERQRLQKKMLKEHKININRALLFGQSSYTSSGGAASTPLRTTQGAINFISTNKYDAGGLLTAKGFEAFSRMSFRYGNRGNKMFLAAPRIVSAFWQWGTNQNMTSVGETTFGTKIKKIETAHGSLMLVNDWSLEDGVSGQNGYAGIALVLDLDQIRMRYLRGSNTQLIENADQTGVDGYTDEARTEAGLEVNNEKTHALLYNVQDYVS